MRLTGKWDHRKAYEPILKKDIKKRGSSLENLKLYIDKPMRV